MARRRTLLSALIALTLTLIVTIAAVVLTGDVADAIVQGATVLVAATSMTMAMFKDRHERDQDE